MVLDYLVRGKHDGCGIKYGIFVYGYFAGSYGAGKWLILDRSGFRAVVHSETVGRFTGLYDGTKWEEITEEDKEKIAENFWMYPMLTIKTGAGWKGRMIFEGDILRHSSGKIGRVEFSRKFGGYEFVEDEDYDDDGNYNGGTLLGNVAGESKIIGDVYENTDLMRNLGR